MAGYGYAAIMDTTETFLDAVMLASTFSAVLVMRKGEEEARPREESFIIFSLEYGDTVRAFVQATGGLAAGLKRSVGHVLCKIYSNVITDGGKQADQILDALADGIDSRADSVGHPFNVIRASTKNGGSPSTDFPGYWQVNCLTPFEHDRA